MFIALEGCDGVGKSTLRGLLEKELVLSDKSVFSVGQHSWLHLPSSRVIASVRAGRPVQRSVVIDSYLQDKRAHYVENVVPANVENIVLADRWILSDAVYCEVLYGVKAEETLERYRESGIPLSNVTLYVTSDVHEAFRRIEARAKAMRHYERPASMTAIMSVYDRVLGAKIVNQGTRLMVIDNDGPLASLVERVKLVVRELLNDRHTSGT